MDVKVAAFTFCKIVFFLSLADQVSAGERYRFYRGARSLGMGGVNAAIVNDETALLTNPAGLAKLRNFYGTLFDPEVHGSTKNYKIYSGTNLTSPTLEELAIRLDSNRGIHYHGKFQMFPSVVLKNFGLGVFYRDSTDAEMNEAGTALNVNYWKDFAAVLGYSFRFFDGRMKFGFNIKYINRVEIVGDVDPNGPLTPKDLASEGTGIANDAGLILTAPWDFLPTIAIAAHDIGTTKFSNPGIFYGTTTRPNSVPQDVDIALAIYPIHSSDVRAAWSAEYEGYLTKDTETDSTRRIHYGMELNFSDLFFFRVGMNQRYWTCGLELATERMQMMITSYGEDIGDQGAPFEDRRVIGKFSFRF